MNKDDDRLLDQALGVVRDDVPDAAAEAAALERTAAALAGNPGVIEHFPALIPDYLAGTLDDDRRALLEEELKSSVPLRRALRAATRAVDTRAGTTRNRPRVRRAIPWAVAAAAAVAVAVGFAVLFSDLPVADQARLARVAPADGVLYRLADTGLRQVSAGEWLSGNEPLRTGKSGSTRLVLDDGSLLEIEARTQLELRRQRGGNRVYVERGRLIVQAAPQGDGRLEVMTDDVLVEVEGTVFGLSHSTKGTRVAVVEGQVDIRQHGDRGGRLRAGEQFDTRGVVTTSVVDDVSWSADAERYADMLAEYAQLKQELGALLRTKPRHSPRLLGLVPDDTTGYVSIPNALAKIAKGYELVRPRLVAGGTAALVDDHVRWLGEVAGYLGEETVVAFRRANPPLLLAEVARDGLGAVLDARLEELVADLELADDLEVELIASPADALAGRLSFWLTQDLLVVSSDPTALGAVEALLAGGHHAFARTKLYARLKESYARGAYYLGGVDLAGAASNADVLAETGMADAETLIVEGLAEDERTRMTAEIRFRGVVPDALTMLDEPGPMGALEFFAPDDEIVAAVLLGNTAELVTNLKEGIAGQGLAEPFAWDFVDDWVGAAGGELAVGLTGVLLPTPAWRAVIEVYDQDEFQRGIETAVQRYNEVAILRRQETRASVTAGAAAPYPTHELRVGLFGLHYAYIGGYFVGAASRALVDQMRRTYESGLTLSNSERFRALLPNDTYLDFSAVAYLEFGDLVDGARTLLADSMPQSRQVAMEVLAEAGPWMYAAYREPDRVKLVVNGPLGLSLPELAILAGASAIPADTSADQVPGSNGSDGS